MALTALSVLRELILRALTACGGAATAAEVIETIAEMPDFVPTEDDLALDEKDRPAWQSRVYAARRHLGDDDLVLAKGRRWVLTAAGLAAAASGASALANAAPQPVPLLPSVIAQPLRDPVARAEVMGRPVDDDDPMPVIIELNVSFTGGTWWAYEVLTDLFVALGVIETKAEMPKPIDEYVPAVLSYTTIRALVEADKRESARPHASGEQLTSGRAIHRVWPNFPVHGQIDQSCRTVKADAARRAFNAGGKGIVWAVVDSGIDATHPHFSAGKTLHADDVIDLHRDFTLPEQPGGDTQRSVESALVDRYDGGRGHGTAVASIIAGYLTQGHPADQLEVVAAELGVDDNVIAEPRPVDAAEMSGMAPEARLVSLKVFSEESDSSNTDKVMAALRYVMEVNARHETRPRIHGVNLSLGYPFDAKWFACGQSPLCRYVDRLVRSGVVVVVAAGNSGYATFTTQFSGRRAGGLPMSINDPGNAERAITVGATHRSAPHTYGVSYFSSKGPTGDGRRKPDLIAPGERITAATAAPAAAPARKATYSDFSGTSFAAPHVSGVVAAFLSVRPEFVSQPEKVKQVLLDSATPLGRERDFEGAGVVDVMRALQSV